MKPKKICCNNFKVMKDFADDLGKELTYKQSGGCGYCECEDSVQVFCKHSYVDTSDEFEDVTRDYK